MKYFSIIAAILLSAAGSAQAAEWVNIGGTDNLVVQIDRNSIASAGGGLIKAWVLYSYGSSQETKDYPKVSYQSVLMLDVFNCNERTSDFLQEVYYSGPNREGNIAKSKTYPRTSVSLSDVVPGSMGESSLDFACNRANQKNKK